MRATHHLHPLNGSLPQVADLRHANGELLLLMLHEEETINRSAGRTLAQRVVLATRKVCGILMSVILQVRR